MFIVKNFNEMKLAFFSRFIFYLANFRVRFRCELILSGHLKYHETEGTGTWRNV